MTEPKPIGPLTLNFLQKYGYSIKDINSWTSETRLFHDLGVYGDDLDDEYWFMQDHFGVDFSAFDYQRYFPYESSQDASLIINHETLSWIGLRKFADYLYKDKLERMYRKYKPITFAMIETILEKKRWVDESN